MTGELSPAKGDGERVRRLFEPPHGYAAPMRALLGFLVLVGSNAWADPRIGDRAPALGGLDLHGDAVACVPGHITLVDFSATWCGPCHAALAALLPLVGANVDLVVMDVGEDQATVQRAYADPTLPLSTRVALDVDGAAAKRWGQHRLPTTFVVDGSGVIRFINRGYGPGYGARIAQRVAALR